MHVLQPACDDPLCIKFLWVVINGLSACPYMCPCYIFYLVPSFVVTWQWGDEVYGYSVLHCCLVTACLVGHISLLFTVAVGTCHDDPCYIFEFLSLLSLVGIALAVWTLYHCCLQRFVQLPPERVRILPLTTYCTCFESHAYYTMLPVV